MAQALRNASFQWSSTLETYDHEPLLVPPLWVAAKPQVCVPVRRGRTGNTKFCPREREK